MFKYISLAAFLAQICFAGNVLKINDEYYTQEALSKLFAANKTSHPINVIQSLKRKYFLKKYASMHGINVDKALADCYRERLRADIGSDELLAKSFDMPELRKAAAIRLDIFNDWVATQLENIHIEYLDINSYWEFVKASQSYQLRQKYGHTPKITSILYTYPELAVETERVLVLKDGQAFVTGEDFNNYFKLNYQYLKDLLSRNLSKDEALKVVLQKYVEEKLITETVDLTNNGLPSKIADIEIRKYAMNNMFFSNFKLDFTDFKTHNEAKEAVLKSYLDIKKQAFKQFKMALIGELELTPISPEIINLIRKYKLGVFRSQLEADIPDKDIYSWMEENKFEGTKAQALKMIIDKKTSLSKSQKLDSSNIVFNL